MKTGLIKPSRFPNNIPFLLVKKPKYKTKSNIVTNSIKILKVVHIKKYFRKEKRDREIRGTKQKSF